MSFSMKLPPGKSTSTNKKQYGLILPASKKAAAATTPAFNAFDAATASSSTSNTNTNTNDTAAAATRKRQVGADAARSVQRDQIAQTHAAALAQDPSVFEYDSVFDDITKARDDKAAQRRTQRDAEKKQPKYISTLLQKAKIREVESERMRERRLLNERKADDLLYGDKEKLISASYKRKLLANASWDAEDARLEALEDAEDVTKRGEHALAGFYANLLSKNIAMGGATTHARSAYTVRDSTRATKRPRRLEQADEDEDEDEKEKAIHGESTTIERPTTATVALSTSRVSLPHADALLVPEAAAATVAETAETAKQLTKDDAVAAAKARFLARKAARDQQQQQ